MGDGYFFQGANLTEKGSFSVYNTSDSVVVVSCKLGVCMTFLFKIACHLIICRNKRI